MTPHECYKTYLAFKNHFNRENFDYFKYHGKTNASVSAFNKRNDRYFFEKLSRQKNDGEIKEFFLASFIECTDSQKLWIREIINCGNTYYNTWKSRADSLTYTFKENINTLLDENCNLDDVMFCECGKHSKLIKLHSINKVSIETMVILDHILHYVKNYDRILNDPIWKFYSMRIRKYRPFMQIESDTYKIILKEKVTND
jgi:hypothetical protein